MAGIYLHIPFCEKKCYYCDFYSVEKLSEKDKFVNYLIKEIDIWNEQNKDIGVYNSVFMGGGTPSLLSIEQMKIIIEKIRNTFSIVYDAEWTVESNPGSLSFDSMKKYLEFGINRLSIGVQSFFESELKFLQRIHDSSEAKKAIVESKESGFKNRNVDIIFSIPGQTKESLKVTLNTIKEYIPEHISAYSLIYEKGTPLYAAFEKNLIKKIDDDTDAELYEFVSEFLEDLGYEHYEVSNFALPGYKCNHNLNYWRGGNYLAFGPSAHGYYNGKRFWNVKSINSYFQMIDDNELPQTGFEDLTPENKMYEKIMLGLRAEGINFGDFWDEFGIDLFKAGQNLYNDWKNNGLCQFDQRRVRLNHNGYFICNSLIQKLIEELEKSMEN